MAQEDNQPVTEIADKGTHILTGESASQYEKILTHSWARLASLEKAISLRVPSAFFAAFPTLFQIEDAGDATAAVNE